MIDLRKYYLDNVKQDEYFYRFYHLIKDACGSKDVLRDFIKQNDVTDAEFMAFDTDDAIAKFRELCQPGHEPYGNQENQCWFYVICFYLNRLGYYIEQFPNVLQRPPKDAVEFIYGEIRDWAFSHDMNDGGTIRYSTRRQIVADLKLIQKDPFIEISESLDDQFKRISTRDASFQDMSVDEKLRERLQI